MFHVFGFTDTLPTYLQSFDCYATAIDFAGRSMDTRRWESVTVEVAGKASDNPTFTVVYTA
jgi:hypothetical protein